MSHHLTKACHTRQSRTIIVMKPVARVVRLAMLGAALSVPVAMAGFSGAAYAQTQANKQQYQIPAGPLDVALTAFSSAAGVTLSSDAQKTRGLQSSGLQGQYTVEEGFRALLANTGLEAVRNAKGQYTLRSPVEMVPVIVTSTRTAHDLRDIPLSVGVVGAKDFQRKPNTNIGDQLKDIPGVQLAGANVAGDRRIMIRGHSAGATLVLVDGVRQPEIRNTAGAGFTINTADIERVEVIKGPASVLYGSDAIGGVVNIITKKGGNKPFGASIGFMADTSNNSIDPRVSVYGATESGFYYRITGSGLNAGERKAGDNTTLYNSDYKQRSFRGVAGYDWDDGSFEFSAERFQGSNNYTPVIAGVDGRFRPAKPAERTTISEVPKNDREAYVATLNLRNLTSNLVNLKTTAYYQELNKGFDYYNFNTGIYSGRHSYLHNAHGLSVQSDWSLLDTHLLTVGVDYDDISMKKLDFIPVNTSNGGQRTVAVFAQDEWRFLPDWTLTAGVRQTWVKTALDSDTANPARVASKSYSNLVSSAGVVYQGVDNLALRALYSQGFKVPNLTQMLIGSGVIIPNPELQPEKSNNFELGARYNVNNFNADIAVFYNTFKNGIINEIVSTGPTRWKAMNVDKATSWGAEAAADYTFTNTGLSVYGNLNLLRYETEDKNGFKTRHSSRSPVWGTLGTGWETAFGAGYTLFTDANMMFGSGAYTQKANGTISDRTDAWKTFNVSVGMTGGTARKYHVTLSLRNLFDKYYQVASPFSPSSPLGEPGFHAVLSAGVEF
jgi:hemoglobin/transferrin/lactoferrin receptor protein